MLVTSDAGGDGDGGGDGDDVVVVVIRGTTKNTRIG